MAELDDVYTQYNESMENLCEAMKIISLSVVDGVSYDKTLTCTITNADNKELGEYTVTDGSVTFKAYSTVTNYTEDTVVYVTVPQGDFKQQKIIIGKKADLENSEPFVYKAPFDSFADFTDNLLPSTDEEYCLLANCPKEFKSNKLTIEIYSAGGKYSADVDENELLNYDSTFTRLGIRGNFYTKVNSAVYGDYGLKVTIYDKYDLISSEEWETRETVYYFSSNSDMYGNPYNYETYYTQEKLFDITDLGIITGIKVEFYQLPTTFKNISEEQIEYQVDGVSFPDNLKVKNIYVAFGYDLNSFDTDYAVLYSFDKSTYIKTKTDEENKKTVNLRWIHVNDKGTTLATPIDVHKDSSAMGDYEINWYRYKLGAPSADGDSGVYWEKTNLDKVETITETLEDLNAIKDFVLVFHYNDNVIGNDVATEYDYYLEFFPEYKNGRTLNETTALSLDNYGVTSLGEWTEECIAYYNLQSLASLAVVGYHMTTITVNERQGWDDLFKLGFVYHHNNYNGWDHWTNDYWTGRGCLHRVGFWELLTNAYMFYWYYPDAFDRLGASSIWKTGGDSYSAGWELYKGKNPYTELSFSRYGELYDDNSGAKQFSLGGGTTVESNARRLLFTYFTLSFGAWEYVKDKYGLYDYRPVDESIYKKLYDAVEFFYQKVENPKTTIVVKPDLFSCEIIPDKTVAEEKLKVIIKYDNEKYFTNILTFTNEEEVPNYATLEVDNALTILCDDGSFGNYRIYNDANLLWDSALQYVKRTLSAHFDLADYSEKGKDTILTDAESITWEFPASNTMISLAVEENATKDDYGDISYSYDTENDLIVISRTADSEGKIIPYINYYIKDNFSEWYGANNVTCSIVKDTLNYSSQKSLNFGPSGTSGTDCTLKLNCLKTNPALTFGTTNSVLIEASLRDVDNVDCGIEDMENIEVEWSWYKTWPLQKNWSTTNPPVQIVQYKDADNKSYKTIVEIKPTSSSSVTMDDLYILLCTVKNWGDYDLVGYIGIPIRGSSEYKFISGPIELRYDTMGNIAYYKDVYRIWHQEENDIKGGWLQLGLEAWTLHTPDTSITEPYYPKLVATTKTTDDGKQVFSGYLLKPLDIYFDISVFGVKYGDHWTQPILVYLNNYSSTMINEWDGKTLKISESEGAILAKMLGAGKKETDNTFSGVLLGDWSKDMNSNEKTNTGVYGFNHGQMSYAFKDDGTAFIGKSGMGRIEFDGNSGIIKSSSYDVSAASGMKIDVDNGEIDIRGAQNEDGKLSGVIISSTSPYLLAVSEDGITLLNIAKNSYYLLSNNFSNDNETGVLFNLSTGRLIGYNFNIRAIKSDSTDYLLINSSASTYPFNINNAFKVDWDGTLYATGGSINGEMKVTGTLTGGLIDGAEITGSYIEGAIVNGGKVYGATVSGAIISGSTIRVDISSSTEDSEDWTNKTSTTATSIKYISKLSSDGGIFFYDGNTLFGSAGVVKGTDSDNNTTYNLGLASDNLAIILQTSNSSKDIALRSKRYIYIDGDEEVTVGESKRKTKLFKVYANEINFEEVPPASQKGIYALFA